MLGIELIEWIGYLGSAVVAISLMMTSMIKLRWLNLLGSIIFTIYGLAINALPIALVNFLIVGVNVVFMVKMYTKKDYFKILEIDSDSQYLSSFLEFYQDKISKEFPKFIHDTNNQMTAILILRNMAIAGVVLAREKSPHALDIILDFVIPQYRDFKPGKFLFVQNAKFFVEKGYKHLNVATDLPKHQIYLRRMGFNISPQNDGQFIKTLK